MFEDLVAYHEGKRDQIAIPAAALAECAHCDGATWDQLKILDLNAVAAILANKLFPSIHEKGAKRATRQQLKFDAAILATAEVHNISILYTTDDWFDKVAKEHNLRVKVRPLPEPADKQLNLVQ